MRGWLVLVLAVLAAMPGCASETEDDDDDEVGFTSDELRAAGGVKVVQCNPFFAGAYAFPDRDRAPRDWSTAEGLSRAMKRAKSEGSVIGMEEMPTLADAEKVRGLLGPAWKVTHWTALKDGHAALGVAVFYRSDLHSLEKDFGRFSVDHIDSDRFGKAAYPILWGGVLLRDKHSGKRFGVFAGKLVWAGQDKNGHPIDEDAARVAEVKRLNGWIDRSMAPFGNATRIITTDQNDERGSPPWRELAKDYADGGAQQHTWKSPRTGKGYRYDYVMWDDASDRQRQARHFPAPYTSRKFTSDHQFVTADVFLR